MWSKVVGDPRDDGADDPSTIAPCLLAEADAAVRDVLTALAGRPPWRRPTSWKPYAPWSPTGGAPSSSRPPAGASPWSTRRPPWPAVAPAAVRPSSSPRCSPSCATRSTPPPGPGLTAVTLNSANIEEWQEIEAGLLADEVDLLLVSPERLANPRFEATTLQVLLPRLGLLVVDEAHCISDWGFDFRPDYQRLTRVMTARPDLPVLATTATANARVTDDVAAQLGDDTVVLRGPLARAS